MTEVIEWFNEFRGDEDLVAAGFNDSDWDTFLATLRNNNITGKVLLVLERVDLEKLGIAALGPRLLLFQRIDGLRHVRSAKGVI